MERLGLQDTGGAVRVGFCHYNTADEVDRVLEELAALC
jgi:selenocysteine lyase/cysteine desulfurase